jgi:hypothetical protein
VLKAYPRPDVALAIKHAFTQCLDLNYDEVSRNSTDLLAWVEGKTRVDIEEAMKGEGEGPLAIMVREAQGDDWWRWSMFWGIGIARLGELADVDMKEEVSRRTRASEAV